MAWLKEALASSLGKKLIMSVTGLFLVLFLIGHVSGNMLLFKNDNGQAFNEYTVFMTTYPGIIALSYATYLSIIFHVIYAIAVTRRNRKARPVGYKVNRPSENSVWTSRNMGILGTLILIFLVIHLKSFWYEMKFGEVPMVDYGQGEIRDLYAIVVVAFREFWYVMLYVFSMFALGFHLSHGFNSGFQTLGLHHKKYTPIVKTIGYLFSIVVPGIFASMPVYFYILSL